MVKPKTQHLVSVDDVLAQAKVNVQRYSGFVRHAPRMLRDSMMLAYQTATDDMLKALDAARVLDPVKHESSPSVVLLDQNGNAAG